MDEIASGSDFVQSFITAIESSNLFLCILSENSYTSNFLKKELSYAIHKQKNIFPVIVDNSQISTEFKFFLPPLIKIYHWTLSSNNIEDTIIKDIGRALGQEKELSKTKKEENIALAKDKKDGSDNYIPKKIDVDIFISYRRVDGRDYARNIMQALKIVGYPKVFFDYNSLRDGIFNSHIIDAIYSCNDFILVISPLALKNCAKKGDWVTKEIRTALKYNKHIIPIVIEDTFKDWPQDFPQDLSAIKNIQFHKLMTDEYFEDSIEKLKGRLTTKESKSFTLPLPQTTTSIETPSKNTFSYKIKVNRKCRLFIDDEEIQTLEAFQLSIISLPKGEYVRKIVDFEDERIFKEDILQLDYDKAEIIHLRRRFDRLHHIFHLD